jgi:hypothetical protein
MMASNRQLIGIFGCGVDNSRLPHFEQTSAPRGFTCNRGQSFASYDLPHVPQKSASPAVIFPHW